jgi:hypothetical protein
MTTVKDLEKRLNKIIGKVWVPDWLSAVASEEELAEWRAIWRSYPPGPDLCDRTLKFQKEMRRKHPEMPLTFEEELERGAQRLKNDQELARSEGLIPELLGEIEQSDSSAIGLAQLNLKGPVFSVH